MLEWNIICICVFNLENTMKHLILVCLLAIAYTVSSQQQGYKIPPGSRVEVEVEIEPPPPGQMPAMSRSMRMPMSGSPMMMMVPQSPMSMFFQGGIQQLLNNMLRVALTFRRLTGNRSPLPMMEEPCPCDVECCTRPMEPRRLLPILELPMTMNRGCCGCVDCPLSLSPAVSNMVVMARMAGQSRRGAGAGGETR